MDLTTQIKLTSMIRESLLSQLNIDVSGKHIYLFNSKKHKNAISTNIAYKLWKDKKTNLEPRKIAAIIVGELRRSEYASKVKISISKDAIIHVAMRRLKLKSAHDRILKGLKLPKSMFDHVNTDDVLRNLAIPTSIPELRPRPTSIQNPYLNVSGTLTGSGIEWGTSQVSSSTQISDSLTFDPVTFEAIRTSNAVDPQQ